MKKFLNQHNAVIALGLSCLLIVNGALHSLQTQLTKPQTTPVTLLTKVNLSQPQPSLLTSCDSSPLVSSACSLQVMTHHAAVNVLQRLLTTQSQNSQQKMIHL